MADYSMTNPGNRPMDKGAAPEKKGEAKAFQRRSENKADYDMHSANPRAYASSGMEQAMGAHADQLHPRPVKKPRRRSNVP